MNISLRFFGLDIFLPNGQEAALLLLISQSFPPCNRSLWSMLPSFLDMHCASKEKNLVSHGDECCMEGVNFIPLVLEYLWGWGQDLIKVGKAIGRL